MPKQQANPQAPTVVRELSIGRHDGQVSIDISGNVPERILFTRAEARKLVAAIEQALNTGFGRDMEAIRQQRVQP
jgi:hypothetical protein